MKNLNDNELLLACQVPFFMRKINDRLSNNDLPSTPLLGDDEEWEPIINGFKAFFNLRYPYLIKIVVGDAVVYNDLNRYFVVDRDKLSEEQKLQVLKIFNENYLIKFPYLPEIARYRIHVGVKRVYIEDLKNDCRFSTFPL